MLYSKYRQQTNTPDDLLIKSVFRFHVGLDKCEEVFQHIGPNGQLVADATSSSWT